MVYKYDKESGTITAKVSTLVTVFILFWILSTYGASFLDGYISGMNAG